MKSPRDSRRAALRLKLPVQEASARILADFVANRRVSWGSLTLQMRSRSGVGEVFHALDLCGFVSQELVCFELGGEGNTAPLLLPLRQALKFILATPAAYWFPGESLLVTWNAAGLREEILDGRNLSSLCARSLLEGPEAEDSRSSSAAGGLTLEGIHKLRWLGVVFHPLKHRAGCQAALSRLRRFLAEFGLSLAHSPGNGTYKLTSAPAPWYTVTLQPAGNSRKGKSIARPKARGAAPDQDLSPREREILGLVRAEGRLETREIRRRLGGITRQTLHPMLKRLEERSLVVRVPNGPHTWYKSTADKDEAET